MTDERLREILGSETTKRGMDQVRRGSELERLIFAAMRRAVSEAMASPATGGVVDEIAAERRRQVEVEGWTPEHDDGHDMRELALAAACYAIGRKEVRGIDSASMWPRQWDLSWWKPSSPRRNLVKAGALIIAEIERLDRATAPPRERSEPEDGINAYDAHLGVLSPPSQPVSPASPASPIAETDWRKVPATMGDLYDLAEMTNPSWFSWVKERALQRAAELKK